MPALFPMPFLARLTSDHTLEGPPDSNATRKRAHEQRAFEERRKEPKRPRLGTQVLSSRPKLFNGLLSPVKGIASSSSASDRAPGRDLAAAKATNTRASTSTSKKFGAGTAVSNSTITQYFSKLRDEPQLAENKVKIGINGSSTASTQEQSQILPPASSEPLQHIQQQQQQQQQQQVQQSAKQIEDKRSLRSHDGGTRARSELAQYFPNWDEIISDEPLPQDPITAKTRLHVIDEPIKIPSTPSRARQVILPAPPTPGTPGSPIAPLTSPSVSRSFFPKSPDVAAGPVVSASAATGPPPEQTFTRISFASELSKLPRHPTKDPLSEEYYRLAHQRGERQEKQLRNIEKEKAQHEKVQLERLYEGLLGPDWLRLMGISGVTDGEKRDKWEAKRDYVIAEVKAMLDKFDRYREEEKRLKLEREAHLRDEESDDEEQDEDEDEDEDEREDVQESDKEKENVTKREAKAKKSRSKKTEVPDSEADDNDETDRHEADHRKRRRRPETTKSRGKRVRRVSTAEEQATAAAKQLLTESMSSSQGLSNRAPPPAPLNLDTLDTSTASAAAKHSRVMSTSSRTGIDVTPTYLYSPAGTERPFTSFFAKPHLRAAAIAGHRRGRARFAFGLPVPEVEEQEFSLPDEWITADSRRDAARMRRMRRRSKKMDSA